MSKLIYYNLEARKKLKTVLTVLPKLLSLL
jgi:hypothetical protein